ncbi:MAG: glutamate-5-semialdehyde dehydrogenase [Desulfobacterales bacterium]|nr:glutamate-5-semialdehyde dehydrogenase [Desulfobacterales bacterium]
MSVESTVVKIAEAARKASIKIARCSTEKKNEALLKIAQKIENRADFLKRENEKDLIFAKEKGLTSAMIERLKITDATIKSMVTGLKNVAKLEDPVGAVTSTWKRPNNLEISKMRIPLGVIGIIYESRPNVTADAAGLCLKSGNAVILRGGSESINSNLALAGLISDALIKTGLPKEAVQVIPVRDREAVNILLKQEELVDLIIPRGGEGLIRFVVQNSDIPVLKHYKGVCHVYVDEFADIETAKNICINSKVQRPGVCNAMETMIVHENIAKDFFEVMVPAFKETGVELRGCEKTCELIDAIPATDEDFHAEYLELILAVKIVKDMEEAYEHIEEYGSLHTEVIVTKDYEKARRFVKDVDASAVMVNASTRFNDGGELGLGAEMGISTSKLHAYGPMGLTELTTTKFVVFGDGQIRQ